MKKYHCFIPGCTTYDTIGNFITIPSDDKERAAWLSVISRKNWIVDSSTLICTKHFKHSDFRIQTSHAGDGTKKDRITKTLIPIDGQSVVPSFFPKTLNNGPVDRDYINNFYPEHMFRLYPRDCKGPDVFADLEMRGKEDFVIDFCYLKLMYGPRLKTYLAGVWKVQLNTDHLIFYITDFSEIPRISVSVKIDHNLSVVVTLAGRYLDPSDLTWVLPISCILNRWSQLEIMLRIYGS